MHVNHASMTELLQTAPKILMSLYLLGRASKKRGWYTPHLGKVWGSRYTATSTSMSTQTAVSRSCARPHEHSQRQQWYFGQKHGGNVTVWSQFGLLCLWDTWTMPQEQQYGHILCSSVAVSHWSLWLLYPAIGWKSFHLGNCLKKCHQSPLSQSSEW